MNAKEQIITNAIDRANNTLGADISYFGKDGIKEVINQLRELGYEIEDFISEYPFLSESQN